MVAVDVMMLAPPTLDNWWYLIHVCVPPHQFSTHTSIIPTLYALTTKFFWQYYNFIFTNILFSH